ncbi:hypothetical protein JRQ81_017402, partial [Phrynocephalus forsythii]
VLRTPDATARHVCGTRLDQNTFGTWTQRLTPVSKGMEWITLICSMEAQRESPEYDMGM